MKRVCFSAALTAIAFTLVACGKSSTPTAPSTPSNPTATVRAVVLTNTSTSASTFQLTARADMSDGTSKDVTNQARWETSNAALASISSTGVLTVLGSGQVEVRATFESVTGALSLLVSGPTQPSTFSMSGVAIETAPSSKVMAGVSVRIVEGPDSGLSTTTDAGGLYGFPSLHNATLAVEARKDGYLLWRITNLRLDRDRQIQIVMFPTPPKNASGVDATARCNDSTWSWDTSRTNVCAANGGMVYAVCPGPLCELPVVPTAR